MIEVAKGLIKLIVDAINSLFVIPIELSENMEAPLGLIIIGVAILAVCLGCIFDFLNIGGDD